MPTLVAPVLGLVSAHAALGVMGAVAVVAMLCLIPVSRRVSSD